MSTPTPTITCRFLGIEADIVGHGRKLQRFGQAIELPEALAKELILGGGRAQGWAGATAMLPEAEFDAIGFTEAQLKYFGLPASWNSDVKINKDTILSVAEFLEKKKDALMALHGYREKIEPQPEPQPEAETKASEIEPVDNFVTEEKHV
jgi:hypothetical protein